MKLFCALLMAFFLGTTAFSQQEKKGSFVIKGQIQNQKLGDTLTSWLTCYIATVGQRSVDIPVANNGRFEKTVEVEGAQNFSVGLNKSYVAFYVLPNDTIHINFDKNNFTKTLSIKGNNDKRTCELNFNFLFSKHFLKKRRALAKKLTGPYSKEDSLAGIDSIRVGWINKEYNQECAFINKDSSLDKDIKQLFKLQALYHWNHKMVMALFLNRPSEFLKFQLTEGSDNIVVDPSNKNTLQYRILNLDHFYRIPEYREFLSLYNFVYYGGDHPLRPFLQNIGGQQDDLNPNWLEGRYYRAMADLNYYPIRDWYITNRIINNFKNLQFRFEQVEQVMLNFLPVCKNQHYKDEILAVYNDSKKYVPGKPAPGFTLKDENGKAVSLADFKGKVVLLDFWGVHCGPCIKDFRGAVPKIHEKYKGKNIVFLNICVEDTEQNWKDAVKKYKVEGINLFAKGWTDDPVCKAYGIESIPHYILIDKEGNFADFNCPASLLLRENNILDKTLAK